MNQMDFLQQNMASEFGLTNLRAKHEGESSMGLRPPNERPAPPPEGMTPQQYLLSVAQQRAPMLSSGKPNGGLVAGMWASPSSIPDAPVTPQEQRGKVTPIEYHQFVHTPLKLETPEGEKTIHLPEQTPPIKYQGARNAHKEKETVKDMVSSPDRL